MTDQSGVFLPFWGGAEKGRILFFLLLGTLFSTLLYTINLSDFSPRTGFYLMGKLLFNLWRTSGV